MDIILNCSAGDSYLFNLTNEVNFTANNGGYFVVTKFFDRYKIVPGLITNYATGNKRLDWDNMIIDLTSSQYSTLSSITNYEYSNGSNNYISWGRSLSQNSSLTLYSGGSSYYSVLQQANGIVTFDGTNYSMGFNTALIMSHYSTNKLISTDNNSYLSIMQGVGNN